MQNSYSAVQAHFFSHDGYWFYALLLLAERLFVASAAN